MKKTRTPASPPSKASPQADRLYRQGNLLYSQAKFAEAVVCYQQAIRLLPKAPMIQCNLGAALWAQGKRTEAIQVWTKVLVLNPDSMEAYNNLGNAYTEEGKFTEAKECYGRALALQPTLHALHNNIAGLLTYQGLLKESQTHYQQALSLAPENSSYFSNYLFSLNYGDDLTDEAIHAAHDEYDQRFGHPPGAFTTWQNPPQPERPLKVAYVSGEFFESSVGFLIEPILLQHTRSHFIPVCYSTGRRSDLTTQRIKSLAADWLDVRSLDASGFAEQIRADGIDILVDLIGHTTANRLPTFALKPAPVQVSYAGYVNTTGLRAVDYYIGDAITLNTENARLFNEIPVQLPCSLYNYLPPAFTPEVAPSPYLKNGFITFASFNTVAKVNPFTIHLWAEVLKALPDSRLLLKDKATSDLATVERLRLLFAQQGIAPERIDLRRYTPLPEHLSDYGQVDIVLDPHPFNGGINSLQALWQGVPLVTLLGTRHASRVGASLLSAVGLHYLIAKTPDEYIAKAIALAKDKERLLQIRQTLREQMRKSSIIDSTLFIKHWESALRLFWRRYCESTSKG